MSFQKFTEQKGELEILSKTPQELIGMMPVSETASQIAEMPPSVAIKQALSNIDAAKKRKEEIIKDIVEQLANLNIIDELMEVHQGTK